MRVTTHRLSEIVVEMLSAETNCAPWQLTDGRVHVVARDPEATKRPAHRRFPPHPGKTAIVTLGNGGVVAVDRDLVPWASAWFADCDRDELFEAARLAELAARLVTAKGVKLLGPFPRFACSSDTLRPRRAPSEYDLEIVDSAAVQRLDPQEWPHALSGAPRPGRPVTMAAVARSRRRVVSVAAVSADSETMWQIGIDVADAHRGRGLGVALTSLAAERILNTGRVPYYTTSSSNIPSMRTALSCGFHPAWVEVFTRPAPFGNEAMV